MANVAAAPGDGGGGPRTLLEEYEVDGRAGSGFFATAFSARRRADGAAVVIKCVSLAGLSAAEREDALQESRLLASVRHPHVVRLLESRVESDNLLLVMDHAGVDLAAYAQARGQDGRLPEAEVLHIAGQVAAGLAHLHASRLLHRDLKSSNCFRRGDDGHVVIGDLGLSRALSSSSMLAQTLCGTPLYQSPELCEEAPYGAASDVWALGCMLHELLSGAPPWTAANQAALIVKGTPSARAAR